MHRFLYRIVSSALLVLAVHVGCLALVVNSRDMPIVYNGLSYSNIPIRRPAGGYSLLRYREAERSGPVDVVFIGSSHSYRTFDTAWYAEKGFTSFNLGSTAQSPINSYYLARRYMERLDPSLVVIDVFSEVMRSDGLESLVDHLYNRGVTRDLVRTTAAIGGFRAWNALVGQSVAFHQTDLATRDVSWSARNGTYTPGGFVRREGASSKGMEFETSFRPFSQKQIRHLDRLVRMVVEQGRRCVLVAQPLPRQTLEKIVDYEEFDAMITRIARDHGIEYYDYNSDRGLRADTGVDPWPLELFYDADHFNAKGADAFNPVFFEQLSADGHLAFAVIRDQASPRPASLSPGP